MYQGITICFVAKMKSLEKSVGEGATPFPGLSHFSLDPYLILLSVNQGGIKYHFLSLWYNLTWD